MANTKDYTVVHPIRHDGRGYDRGATIPASKFTDEDAARLLGLGVIREGGAPAVVEKIVYVDKTPWLTPDELGAYSVPQLNAYGAARGLTIAGKTKDEIVSEINQAAQAGAKLAEAEALAAAQGR